MLFSSIIFLFGFLPIVLLVFHLSGRKIRLPFLLFSSLFFYFFGENYLLWIILASTIIDYCCALIISGGYRRAPINQLIPGGQRNGRQKFGLILSIVSNLAFLGYFKYSNFFIDSFNDALGALNIQSSFLSDIANISLPLGISFYTFQSMSYTIDVYRGKVKANRNFLKIATYVTMFPQLVAGPIVRYADIEKQLDRHKVRMDQFVDGIKRFIIGLAKKVLIANTMAKVADQVFLMCGDELTTGVAWIGVVAYSLQIYFDFSGYSCMAIGIGKMLGFDYPENFNYPYIAKSIKDFWRRWHISLSTWFRDYLYISLGGNRNGKWNTYRNLLLVFSLCGLWHGASWNFVVWGLFHGLFIVLERTRFNDFLDMVPAFLRHIYVLMVVVVGWVFFRTESIQDSIAYLQAMFAFQSDNYYILLELLRPDVIIMMVAGFIFSAPVVLKFLRALEDTRGRKRIVLELPLMFVHFALLLLCAMSLASGTYNPFIYFRF
ncbi:MAG: hypothetical protein K9G67_15670 [Bacteroidales bacterium]|nr:hypothetical protein [Bacteroidales bacterium]MCF8377795.1 hypothetical protein [Bacteroidales bacterium]